LTIVIAIYECISIIDHLLDYGIHYKFKTENKKLHWSVVLLMWAISAALGLAVLYGLTEYYVDGTIPTKTANVFYLAFSR
jgi:hypothetical protein